MRSRVIPHDAAPGSPPAPPLVALLAPPAVALEAPPAPPAAPPAAPLGVLPAPPAVPLVALPAPPAVPLVALLAPPAVPPAVEADSSIQAAGQVTRSRDQTTRREGIDMASGYRSSPSHHKRSMKSRIDRRNAELAAEQSVAVA
jgi:hypothetical protein